MTKNILIISFLLMINISVFSQLTHRESYDDMLDYRGFVFSYNGNLYSFSCLYDDIEFTSKNGETRYKAPYKIYNVTDKKPASDVMLLTEGADKPSVVPERDIKTTVGFCAFNFTLRDGKYHENGSGNYHLTSDGYLIMTNTIMGFVEVEDGSLYHRFYNIIYVLKYNFQTNWWDILYTEKLNISDVTSIEQIYYNRVENVRHIELEILFNKCKRLFIIENGKLSVKKILN